MTISTWVLSRPREAMSVQRSMSRGALLEDWKIPALMEAGICPCSLKCWIFVVIRIYPSQFTVLELLQNTKTVPVELSYVLCHAA